jgi:glycerol-3-phosphate dehydrogenase
MYDLFIIGGGINGTGIARDAAGRGLKVFLAEQNDLAQATSSSSTKLIHGGLRYLEHYEFRLVREALIEREVLLNMAPHIIWPLRFVLPHHSGLRPRFILRLGLFIYDHLGGRKILPGTRSIRFSKDVTGEPLKDIYQHGYEYSDCWVDDARLVVLNARDARARGAQIRPRSKCVGAERIGDHWEVKVRNQRGDEEIIQAKILLNASGPWVSQVLDNVIRLNHTDRTRMVKGSHIVVDKIYDHNRCYIFQNSDNRICFAIPYERDYTLIGTTDEDFSGDPEKIEISQAETDYLLKSVNEYFRKQLSREDIRWSYSGVRPLYDDGASQAQKATRDYVLTLDEGSGKAPLLSVFGGKITTYRKLAESALEKLAPFFPQMGNPWTAGAHLPGGNFTFGDVANRLTSLKARYNFMDPKNLERMLHSYGTDVERILGNATSAGDLGKWFGPLSQSEVEFLRNEEWAVTADDIIWRRSKLGLHMSAAEREALASFLANG